MKVVFAQKTKIGHETKIRCGHNIGRIITPTAADA